ncbi:hypothetical protein ACIBG8_54635 [Nonomuraea sp. NPDC050556]|uniref:hypothetical protein n=1 Tax=Nonomuraea sp. NPDC050556 TaxID=3364369 RepID=UPI00379E4F8D
MVTGAGGISVSGNGSPANPYVVLPVGDDPAWTAAVGTALADIAGPGIIYTTGTNKLQVKLSADEGNTLSFGSDSGLFDSGGGGPTPDPGGATVAGLPATGVVGGWSSGGAGYLLAPECTPQSFEQAVALDLDIITMRSWALEDGTLVTAPAQDLTQYVQPRGGTEAWLTLANMSLARFKNLVINAGNQADSYTGWWGWYAVDGYGMCTLDDAFRLTARRAVLAIMPSDDEAWTSTLDQILRFGLTKSVIVIQYDDRTLAGLDKLAAYKNATVACAAAVRTDAEAAVLTPAVLSAAGVTWVVVSTYNNQVSDANISAYKAAGLNVLLLTESFHYQTDKATSLGVRGVLAEDPIYASKNVDRYRALSNGSHNGNRYIWYGMLSLNTYKGARWSGANVNQAYRGYYSAWTVNDAAFSLPRGTGNYAFGILLGNIAPPPNPQRFTWSMNVRFYDLPSDKTRWVGGAICCPNDAPWGLTATADNPIMAGGNSGYQFGLRANGNLAAWKLNPAVTYSEVKTGLTPVAGTSYTITVTVDPDKVVVACNGKSITIADKDFRGNYAHLLKHDGNNPFRAQFSVWGYS